MSECRYNIPKQYRVDKGMPLEALYPRMKDRKCREIFETEIVSMEWCYHITDGESTPDMASLLRKKGISVFEVITRQKISPELMTEVFADLIRKRFVIVYLCEQEIAMATFVPGENEEEGKICATDFYSYDMSHMIEILDFEQDANKSVEEIHNRIMSEIRQQKKEIMIEKAFAGMHKSVQQEPDLEYEFSEENLEKIREDANFVQEQLRVDVKA